MPIRPIEVTTFSKIPSFVPFGVEYFTQDTADLYVGTGASSGPAVVAVNGANSGAGADSFLAASTNQTLNPGTGNLYVDATAGAGGITLTLPTAVGLTGQKIIIVMIDTGVGGVTINTTSAQTINGASSYVLTNQWQTVTVESNGTNWRVVAAAG